jgi:hypothetical protein
MMPKLVSSSQSAPVVTTLTGRTKGRKNAERIGSRKRLRRITNSARRKPAAVLGTTVRRMK